MMHGRPRFDPAQVRRAKRGDIAAQEAIYRAFAPMVYTLARRMLVCVVLAEDILQETFVEVLHKLADLRDDAELGAWIKRIAVNKCLSHLRSGWTVNRAMGIDPDDMPHTDSTGQAELALERALAALSGTARAVVWLHDVEGYTHKEIAVLMGRSASFSKSQLARAHARLRQSLEESPDKGELPLCSRALKTS